MDSSVQISMTARAKNIAALKRKVAETTRRTRLVAKLYKLADEMMEESRARKRK